MLLKPLLFTSGKSAVDEPSWIATLGGSDLDAVKSITISPDGNYIYVCGNTNFTGAGRDDFLIAKYDSLGNIQWQKTLGGSSDDYGESITISPDGNYIYVCGRTSSTGARDDCLIAKYDSSGNIQWQKTLGGSDDDTVESITISPDGNFIYVCGHIYSTGGYDCLIAKYDSSGNIQWQKTLGESNLDMGESITISPDGNYIYVCGRTLSTGAGRNDFLIVKYDSSGNIQWQKTLGGSNNDYGESITISPDGNYIYVCGSTSSTGAGGDDFLIAKYDSSGNIQWQRTLGGSDDDYEVNITISPDGNYIYVCGRTSSTGAGRDDCLIAKYDSSGNIQWQKTLGRSNYDMGYGITISPDGNYIYVCGRTLSTGSRNYDCLIAKITKEAINKETVEIGPITLSTSNLTSRTSNLTSRTSNLTSRTSNLTSRTSNLTENLYTE